MAQPGLPRPNHILRALSASVISVLCFSGSALAADVGRPPKVVVDRWDQKIVRRSVVIAPREFSPARAEEISRDFLNEKRGKYTVLKLSIFVDEGDETRTDSGKGSTGMNYGRWRRLYELYGREPLPMARTIAIRGDAVLQWRDEGGRIGRKVLSGQDPLFVRAAGHVFEILDIEMWKLPYSDKVYRDSMQASAIVRTLPTSTEKLRSFANLLASRFRLSDLSIAFRSDAWFITDSEFSIVYRFDQVLPPPTEREYIDGFRGHCWLQSGKMRCEVGGPL